MTPRLVPKPTNLTSFRSRGGVHKNSSIIAEVMVIDSGNLEKGVCRKHRRESPRHEPFPTRKSHHEFVENLS